MMHTFFFLFLFVFFVSSSAQNAYNVWFDGSANYKGLNKGDDLGDGCAYGYAKSFNLGVLHAAASPSLWKSGKACGTCYEVKCDPAKNRKGSCIRDKTVIVTITDLCHIGGSGYCNLPKKHLSLSVPAFLKIAPRGAGFINTVIRRVPCKRQGNIKFKLA